MKRRVNLIYPLIALTLVMGVSCEKNEPSSSEGSNISNFEAMKKALTFEENDTFTGYRLSVNMTSLSTSEVIYNLQKNVSINRENQTMYASETLTYISDSEEAQDGKVTETHVYYYDVGSRYTLQSDGNYLQEDGTVDQNPPITLNPKEEYFSDMDYQKSGNAYVVNGKIVSSKANDLFATTGLESIKNATIGVEFYDAILEKVSFAYEVNNVKISENITISYNAPSFVMPVA